MDWTVSGVATALLSGSPWAILITLVVALGLPLLLHLSLYRAATLESATKDFLLLGPASSGKTALCSLLEQRPPSTHSQTSQQHPSKPAKQTHTSQSSSLVTITLPSDVPTYSNRFRSVNDPSLAEASRNPIRYRLHDTPGHGKLRTSQGMSTLLARSNVKEPRNSIRGVVFVVDAAALAESDDDESLRDATTYLYDVLMTLQRRVYGDGRRLTRKVPAIPVLVAANKQDLFTALPPNLVREKLETEIEKIRQSRRKGLMDAGVGVQTVEDEEPEVLGGDESKEKFSFEMLEEETGVKVDVIGGTVKGDEGDRAAGVRRWEEWIGMRL